MAEATIVSAKKHYPIWSGDKNYTPMPPEFVAAAASTGLLISTYFESASSGVLPGTGTRRRYSFYCISHLISGDGFFCDESDSIFHTLTPGQGILVPPGREHQYGGLTEQYVEDALCFTGPFADMLFSTGIISGGVLFFRRDRPLLPIIQELRKNTLESAVSSHLLLGRMLLDLSPRLRHKDSADNADRINRLLRVLANSESTMTVSEMADYCNLSENQFRNCFRARLGVTPRQYLDRMFMTKAIRLLRTPNLKVFEAAEILGYSEPNHFFRRFRKLTGTTPEEFRRRHRS